MGLDLFTTEDLPEATSEAFEEGKFAGCQDDFLPLSPHGPRREVNLDFTDPHPRVGLPAMPPHDRLDSRGQLGKSEGFHQVVVRPEGEAAHTILDCIHRREDDDRSVVPFPPPGFEQLQTTTTWQHQIEDDHVVVIETRHEIGLVPVSSLIHGVAEASEGAIAPSLVSLGRGAFLLAWTGGPASAHQVRAQVIDGAGVPAGDAFDVSERGANAGQARGAVNEAGRGALVYFAAKDADYELLAAPIVCSKDGK